MPYYVAANHPECDTDWAVVKEGNELVACHVSRAAAVRQMVAASLSEGIEPGGVRD
jgi:hypothetical protein